MAENMNGSMTDSFHSLSHSSSSFRIVNAAAELPSRPQTTSAPVGTESHNWEQVGSSSSSFGHARSDSFGRSSHFDGHTSTSGYTPRSLATIRPTSPLDVRNSVHREQDAPMTPSTKYIPAPKAPPRVMKKEVWRDMFLTSDGRDKAFKLIQYTMRVYLYFHLKSATVFTSKFGADLTTRLKSTMSGLSLTRKCLIMFKWLTPLIEITNPPPLPFSSSQSLSVKQSQHSSILYRLLHAPPPTLLDLTNGLADDTYTLSRLGLVGPRIGNKADKLANWLWFLSTLAGLVEVQAETGMVNALMSDLDDRIYDVELDPIKTGRVKNKRESAGLVPSGKPNNVDLSVGVEEAGEGLEKLRQQSWSLRITRWKLLMDLIFVSYEVFQVKPLREPAMAFSGLLSAVLSSSKLYEKHRAKVAKAHLAEA
ncbi:hypothetical protein FRB95_001691 [Tulasnella sp. JGI-2019a]|nr:hypothetical protein FRB95_001691 [Tulasnella sp. JGI-2019a]